MKKLLVALVLLCTFGMSHAQMRVGILGGPVVASVKETNSLPGWSATEAPRYSSRPALHLGAQLEIPINARVSFQPGLMYTAKGRKYFMSHDTATSILTDTISSSSNMAITYIEAPLNVAYQMRLARRVNLVVSAGPYVGFFYGGKQRTETRVYSTNNFKYDEVKYQTGSGDGKVKTLDFGVNARAGFEIGNLMLSGFISRGLTSFYHPSSYDGTFKHHVYGASMGFWLNKLVKPASKKVAKVTIPANITIPATPVDSDGDGISDSADHCPNQAGTPDFNGCPIPDSDGDGVIDTADHCPAEVGPADNHGCPEVAPAVTPKDSKDDGSSLSDLEKLAMIAAHNIIFNANSDQLTIKSLDPLDDLVALLLAHPNSIITIEGHTDASGKPALNKVLSQKRAETVRLYLIQNGIQSSRIKAVGYGSERPLDTNRTAEGRARNRRVEIRLGE